MYRVDSAKYRTFLAIAMCVIILGGGCRSPWKPASLSGEPSFDDLIALERSEVLDSGARDPITPRLKTDAAIRDSGSDSLEPPAPSRMSKNASAIDSDVEDELLSRAAEAVAMRARQREQSEKSGDEDAGVSMSLSDFEENVESATALDGLEKGIALKRKSKLTGARTPEAILADDQSKIESASATVEAKATSADDRTETSMTKPNQDESASEATQSQELATTGDWQDQVRSAIEQLSTQYDETTNPEQRVSLEKAKRMLNLTVGNLDAALQPVDGIEADAQEYLRYSLQSWHDVTDPTGNPNSRKRYSLALQSQRKALQHLSSASDLDVRNTAFCTSVDSYGDVTPFEKAVFVSDQEVLLYCEVDNFVSRKLSSGEGFETHLQGSYEIVDVNGKRIDDQPLPADQHVCSNQRRDYFIVYRLWMPKSISAGDYKLRLTVEDLNGRKFGHSTIGFKIEK